MSVPRSARRRLATAAALVVALVTLPVLDGATSVVEPASAAVATHVATTGCGPQPPAIDEPSGAPPLAQRVLPGWTRIYCTDFLGAHLPPGWLTFKGRPQGDPAGLWEPTHVQVQGGVLDLTTSRDPAYHDAWVSGGACLCGLPVRYGAFFVRSRLTGGGPASVQLLWPKDNHWPPEVDFYESWQFPNNNTFTVHWASTDHKAQGWRKANMTKWHTWGVFWTPTKLVFVVDWGANDWSVWGTLDRKGTIPTTPMTLDLQQEAWCSIAPNGCPTKASAMLIDWVTVFVPTTSTPELPSA